jgi:hypothetical protein
MLIGRTAALEWLARDIEWGEAWEWSWMLWNSGGWITEMSRLAAVNVGELSASVSVDPDELAAFEQSSGIELSAQYREWLCRVGGGDVAGVLELFVPGVDDGPYALRTETNGFVEVASDGMGNGFGFLVDDGRCGDAVFQHQHSLGEFTEVFSSFRDLVAAHLLMGDG